MLRLELEDRCGIVACSDDVALTMALKLNRPFLRTNGKWIEEHGLVLAHEKTEAIIFNGGKNRFSVTFRLDDTNIVPIKQLP